jgi:lysophospholipase L1-like esterase
MSGRDRSWTIAPTLFWFVGGLIVALLLIDGNVSAIADRLTAKREQDGKPAAAGPSFAPRPVMVADADDDPAPKPPPAPVDKGDRSRVGWLEDVCVDGTRSACKRWGMDGFYRAASESKRGKLGRAVHVSWYGDSVIATDAIPNQLRGKLQASFGNGGLGFVYIVEPHRYCKHELMERTASGWGYPSAISTTQIADKMYGVGGSTAETYGGRATFKIPGGAPVGAELYYMAQPKGGTITITADGTEVLKQDTASETKQPAYATAKLPDKAKRLELEAKGKVRVFGIALENPIGIVVDNLGIVGANVKSFGNHDAAHFTAELGHRKPDLVMIMIGANEAAWLGPGDKDTKEYAQKYEPFLRTIRAARPDASCLVVSPTDQAESKDGKYPSRPVMPVLVEQQRKAAHAAGCAFFSTYDWMGGRGSAVKWFSSGMVGGDFQHLTHKGAAKMAGAIYDDLMAGLGRYAGP